MKSFQEAYEDKDSVVVVLDNTDDVDVHGLVKIVLASKPRRVGDSSNTRHVVLVIQPSHVAAHFCFHELDEVGCGEGSSVSLCVCENGTDVSPGCSESGSRIDIATPHDLFSPMETVLRDYTTVVVNMGDIVSPDTQFLVAQLRQFVVDKQYHGKMVIVSPPHALETTRQMFDGCHVEASLKQQPSSKALERWFSNFSPGTNLVLKAVMDILENRVAMDNDNLDIREALWAGHIIVFVSSEEEVEALVPALKNAVQRHRRLPNITSWTRDGPLPFAHIFAPTKSAEEVRILLCTDSVLDGAKLWASSVVIDNGQRQVTTHNPQTNETTHRAAQITPQVVRLRTRSAGSAGDVYHLYSKQKWKEMTESNVCNGTDESINSVDLSLYILHMLAWDTLTFKWFYKPPKSMTTSTYNDLLACNWVSRVADKPSVEPPVQKPIVKLTDAGKAVLAVGCSLPVASLLVAMQWVADHDVSLLLKTAAMIETAAKSPTHSWAPYQERLVKHLASMHQAGTARSEMPPKTAEFVRRLQSAQPARPETVVFLIAWRLNLARRIESAANGQYRYQRVHTQQPVMLRAGTVASRWVVFAQLSFDVGTKQQVMEYVQDVDDHLASVTEKWLASLRQPRGVSGQELNLAVRPK